MKNDLTPAQRRLYDEKSRMPDTELKEILDNGGKHSYNEVYVATLILIERGVLSPEEAFAPQTDNLDPILGTMESPLPEQQGVPVKNQEEEQELAGFDNEKFYSKSAAVKRYGVCAFVLALFPVIYILILGSSFTKESGLQEGFLRFLNENSKIIFIISVLSFLAIIFCSLKAIISGTRIKKRIAPLLATGNNSSDDAVRVKRVSARATIGRTFGIIALGALLALAAASVLDVYYQAFRNSL